MIPPCLFALEMIQRFQMKQLIDAKIKADCGRRPRAQKSQEWNGYPTWIRTMNTTWR